MFEVYFNSYMYQDAVLISQKRISIFKALYNEENDDELIERMRELLK